MQALFYLTITRLTFVDTHDNIKLNKHTILGDNMKKKKRKSNLSILTDQIKKNKAAFTVYAIIRLMVILVLIRCILLGKWESVFVCLLTLVLLLLPAFVEKKFKIDLPTGLEITAFVFVFCAEILGEISAYYVKIPFWDTALHTTSGFIFAAFGFCILDLLNRNKKLNFSPLTLALMAFCFSMTIGVLWEFFEFGADLFVNSDMQKDTIVHNVYTVTLDDTLQNRVVSVTDIVKTTIESADGSTVVINGYLDTGITDTMKDLFVNFIGAVVFCAFGYIYVTKRGKHATRKIVEGFVPKVKMPEEKPYDSIPETDSTDE